VEDEAEPLGDRVRHEIFNFAKVSLNVENIAIMHEDL